MLGSLAIAVGIIASTMIEPVFANQVNPIIESSKIYVYEEDLTDGEARKTELNEELVNSSDYVKFISLSINRLKLGEKFTINTEDAEVIFRKKCPNCKVNGVVFEKSNNK